MSIQDASDLMAREHVHRLPVLDKNGKLVGVISEKDILKAAPSPASTLSAYETNYLLSKLTEEDHEPQSCDSHQRHHC